jgi:2-amino-4-hydroxy-6-hydroxymethyldihydropteridine diphosphokinase
VNVPHTLYLLLGANLGDPRQTFAEAQQQLTKQVGPIEAASALYESEAWGVAEAQPTYLNQVLRLGTWLTPEAVLARTQAIELALGRTRTYRYAARLIDIDLLFYDDLVLQTPALTLPHPLLHLRKFTLDPLAEIAPDFVHPVLEKTIAELAIP